MTHLVVFAGLPGSGKSVLACGGADATAARAGWVALAAGTGAELRFVGVRCSDDAEHRRRVEAREPEMPGQSAQSGGRT